MAHSTGDLLSLFSKQITIDLGADIYYDTIGEHSVSGRADSMLELELLYVALVQVVISPISRTGVSQPVCKDSEAEALTRSRLQTVLSMLPGEIFDEF